MSSSQPSATTSDAPRLAQELLGLFLELLIANACHSNTAQSGFLTQELEPVEPKVRFIRPLDPDAKKTDAVPQAALYRVV